ncbi:MAG TPA: RsmE family RNA methyltransferase [Vicinamibacterales bacterium]|jgi:16S rRNA (uracil1498-N3)-methyltransferase|nr:RsmE family RNA methyltransferase [Vicinamibacterales bacterium]
MHRFFAPALDPGDDTTALPKDEAEHATRVLRLAAGETVAVFDGRGHEYLARIVSAARRDVVVQVLQRAESAAESAVPLTLVQAVLKGEKMDDVVRDAVMLGVAAIQPLVTKRAETTVAQVLTGRLDRWRRVALASVKQSKRAVLPEIRTPLTLEHYLGEPASSLAMMLVEPGTGADGRLEPFTRLLNEPPPLDASLIVGPEGGWVDGEWAAAADRGIRLMTLGHRTLRADAVAISAVSILQFLWDCGA